MRPETIKILGESIASNFSDFGHSNIFLDMTPKAKKTKAKINYWEYIKIKSFYMVKEIRKLKGNQWNGRRYS